MIEASISRRYAKALIELAAESGRLDSVLAEVIELARICDIQPHFLLVVGNRFVDQAERIQAVAALCSKMNFSRDVQGLLTVLIKKSRINLLSMICEEFRQRAMKINNQVEARFISAVELEDNVIQQIRTFLSQNGSEVIVKKEIDPRVLGGVRVVMGNEVYDATVQADLDQMAQAMRQTRL